MDIRSTCISFQLDKIMSLSIKKSYFCAINLFFHSLTGLTFLDLQQYWVKHTWPLCPYVDEWLPHTYFVRFWCSGVDSVTLTRKLCDPSALKAVWPQLRPGKNSSLYGASASSKILHPVCCSLVRSNEWLLLLPLYSEGGKKENGKKNTWLVLIAEKPCWSPKVWRRSTLSVPSLGN